MYRLIMVLGVAATACFLGCGSSDNQATPETATKAEFIQHAEKACARIARDQEAALVSWRKHFPGGAAEAEEHLKDAFSAVIIPSMQRQARELARIPVPEGDEAKVSQMTRSLLTASRALEQKGLEDVRHSVVYAFKRAAFAYGLKTCPVL